MRGGDLQTASAPSNDPSAFVAAAATRRITDVAPWAGSIAAFGATDAHEPKEAGAQGGRSVRAGA